MLEGLCSTNDMVQCLVRSGGVLVFLALLVGHADMSPAFSGRQGSAQVVSRSTSRRSRPWRRGRSRTTAA